MKRRIIAALLALFMCLALLPSTVLAADPLYHTGDIAIINEIIDTYAVDWEKAPADGSVMPDTWYSKVKWTANATNNRVIELNLENKGLTGSLDVSGLANLIILNCSNNQLSSLNVSGLTALFRLDCSDNKLTKLDVSNLTDLEYLYCDNNQLTELNLSGTTALYWFHCEYNQLTSLDVSGKTDLTYFYCDNNRLTSLDASNLTELWYFNCDNNQLTTLNVSGCTQLESLNCCDNQLSSLDVSNLTSLEELDCSNNKLTGLNVSGCKALESLNCYDNQLSSLDVSNLTSLEELDCSNNKLTGLNVSALTALYYLDCYNNKLTTLDFNGCTALDTLDCRNNRLTALDVRALKALDYLDCEDNQLSSLKVSGLASLSRLYCGYNYLTELDVSGTNNLRRLWVRCNSMESKDKVTGKTINWDGTNFVFDPQYTQYYDVSYTVEQVGGAKGTADSTGIKITFDRAVDNFTKKAMWAWVITGNIKVGELTGSGDTWTLEITEVIKEGDIGMRIVSFENFRMPSDSHTVTVYKGSTQTPTYKVTVNRGVATPDTAEAGVIVTITADNPKPGQRFKNWTVNSDNVTLANASSANTTFKMPASTVEVTANYETIPATTYSISVTGGEAHVNGTKANEAEAGVKIDLIANVPEGKVFDQWIILTGDPELVLENANSGTTSFTMPAKAVALQAAFKDKSTEPDETEEVTVTFDPAGGKWNDGTTASKKIMARIGDEITIIEAPVKKGYTFHYWQDSKYQPGNKYQVPAGGYTFTAVWIKTTTTKPTDPDQTLPKTGENMEIYRWSSLLLLTAGGLLFVLHKKRISKQRD